MVPNQQHIQQCLNTFDFLTIFIEELGWDRCEAATQHIRVDDDTYLLQPIAEKRGMIIYICTPDQVGILPEHERRSKIEKKIAKLTYEHIIIYIDAQKEHQIWQWVRRESKKSLARREVYFHKDHTNEHLLMRLIGIAFHLQEESGLGIAQVALRARKAFDIDRVTTKFYEQFQQEHAIFLDFIEGITSLVDREWYTSLMLNRLMFVYFIQKKGFLDRNVNYLSDKLRMMQEKRGKNMFLSFYHNFLLCLFHEALNKPKRERAPDLDELLGDVHYLNGGLFEIHELERGNTNIHIPDEAFQRIFAFFDSYQWQIDEQPLLHDGEINPDVIGYIFEKYINQKQMGAYYTREDITGYISKNAIIPYLFQAIAKTCNDTFVQNAPIWQLVRSDPERYISDTIRTKEYLLTETEREYDERRARYQILISKLTAGDISSITEFIHHNLNIGRFAQDAIQTCKQSEALRTCYECITTISILDPTCGSGAFLFAALNVLQPLYEACLDRMAIMITSTEKDIVTRDMDLGLFKDILTQIKQHPNRAYFILKAITINSLYGVDIMKEAVEICKLRLFLKLVAQLKRVEEIEPLPDIDFNIRAGNTLVGFTHYREVREAVLGKLQSKLDFDFTMESIEQEAQKVEQELILFRELQTRLEGAPAKTRQRKPHLRAIQKGLRTKLNRYLASQYGKDERHMPEEHLYQQAFEEWCNSSQPFHWFIDFYSIMARGGFDVIIGNPPFVEYSKVRQHYKVQGYETESCGNLYAAIIERSLVLSRPGQSYLGLIVPLSVCGGERFEQLRHTMKSQLEQLWLANFEIFPSRLFDGAFQRLSILIARHGKGESCIISTTRIQRWYAAERPYLIDLIQYTHTRYTIKADAFPKLASPLQETILQKLIEKAHGNNIARILSPTKTEHFVYYQEATNYWMKATCIVPYYKKNGVVMEPTHGRFLYFSEQRAAQTIMAVLNSSLFYLWFATFSDGFHLAHRLVKEFPLFALTFAEGENLERLAVRLEEDIKVHARPSTRNTKAHAIELEEYRMSASKGLLDKIDGVLGRYYGLSEEELAFVVGYDEKYRMRGETQ